ncbi:anti-phage-associated DUF1156 domain-containing protein [Photobacterium kishitanii]|uniref:anti-phage-associated DUF1156 domain-containing protein n=1 Tax=Photobacterium kishitanii TaxID=318456 RepID=UPI000434243F|nr:anti-phage-associated DUF1156 domain-containing protein [Photobacterium kishitanii]CEO40191.1 conserved hypothetical protein [Photobacterium kishitanii]
MVELKPFALKDAPALIEAVFPAQKISFEAQKERKSGAGQTMTALGSYWKGRKPLILVRSIVLGSLLPQSNDIEKDLEIFELLMGFDDESLSRRALIQNVLKPKDFSTSITINNPWQYFAYTIKDSNLTAEEVDSWGFPKDLDTLGVTIRWRRDIKLEHKLSLYRKYIISLDSYEAKSTLCKRPEEVKQEWLYEPSWNIINEYYQHLGINAKSHQELIEQLGILRFGRRPRVGDTFSGGGSIPFEAARLGCDVSASDLNPIACMLTWGALNIIGSPEETRKEIENDQKLVVKLVDQEITKLGIEHDKDGNRAKTFFYCLEARCPESGWLIPLSPSWVISKAHKVIAVLTPNKLTKSFNIDLVHNASDEEFRKALNGTIQKQTMVYELDGKTFRTPIKTLRGDYKDAAGITKSNLRAWSKEDFIPRKDDIFQERLYAIHWMTKASLSKPRQETFFTAVSKEDEKKELIVKKLVQENLASWQEQGLVSDMAIESGYNTDQPKRERGWTYWHHMFNPRQLINIALFLGKARQHSKNLATVLSFSPDGIQRGSRLCRVDVYPGPGRMPKVIETFSDQVLNPLYNYGVRGWFYWEPVFEGAKDIHDRQPILDCIQKSIVSREASKVDDFCDYWITDPPYADAVNYHEITEFFIAWLRKSPPKPFDEWTWDSRRALAIKGSGDNFRKGMVDAYKAMADHMPTNGMQCVMFTHQDTGVWSDMVGIFWAAGLQVVGAWYIATETTSEQKKGGYVQGTVILMLRKRSAGEKMGFKQRLLPAVRAEVKNQIETMMHLNDNVKDKMGEPVFNDSDLQMAGYAAALKVLTSYTNIGGEDVTSFALRPRTKGEVTVVDEIVQQAAEAANSLLVPEGLGIDTWQKLSGIQRFYLRMMDIETTGAGKLDNYQNFAKAFRVGDYTSVMGSMAANNAQLKRIPEFVSRDLIDSNEIGPTWLGQLIIGLQQLLAEVEPQTVINQLQNALPDFIEIRGLLIDVLKFIENKAPEQATRDVAEVLGARLRNMRALGN